MISTRDLLPLPDIATLRRRMQSLAMLDAILSPDWEERYFSFDGRWAKHEEMGSMRDGGGGHYFAWFGPGGCWIKGFDPDAAMSPFVHKPPRLVEGLFDRVPREFAGCLREPAFVLDETTFCVWQLREDTGWHHGPVTFPANDPDPDGSAALLAPLDGVPKTYAAWATEYYECDVPVKAVEAVYAHRKLDDGIVRALGGKSVHAVMADATEIGYPIHAGGRR